MLAKVNHRFLLKNQNKLSEKGIKEKKIGVSLYVMPPAGSPPTRTPATVMSSTSTVVPACPARLAFTREDFLSGTVTFLHSSHVKSVNFNITSLSPFFL
jgi:hypothetical protein